MKLFSIISYLISGIILFRFSLSKLLAWPTSVASFQEMAAPLLFNPTVFRVATGIILLIICFGYLLSAFLTIINEMSHQKASFPIRLITMTNLLAIIAMIGALLAEFFLRDSPKILLVFIAIGIIFIAVTSLIGVQRNVFQK